MAKKEVGRVQPMIARVGFPKDRKTRYRNGGKVK